MTDDGVVYRATRRSRGIVGPIIAIVFAFVAGCAGTAYAVRHWERIATIVRPTPATPVRITTVAQPVVPLARAMADAKLVARLDELDRKLSAIDGQAREASGNADRAEALLVAFAARRFIDRGQPLGYLEMMLRNHFGGVDPQAVAMVIASAQRPVTLDRLQREFADLMPSLVAPPLRQSWWTGFRREMGTLFVVRRAETPSVLPDDRRDRARRALEQGQVELALAETVRLPGADRARDWIASARRYVLAHNALDRIETAALLEPEPEPAPSALPPTSPPAAPLP